MIYFKLFWSFIQVGLFSVGGGYAAIPIIQSHVTANGWLSLAEFTDLVTIAEMTPGPIAVNSATFVGIRIAGVPGALVATLGCILPSCIIVTLLAKLYFKYKQLNTIKSVLMSLRPAVVALIASAGLSILKLVLFGASGFSGSIQLVGLVLFAAAFFVLRRFKPSPILVMAACGAAGLAAGTLGLYS